MPRKKYGYKSNRPVPGLPAQKVGAELERIHRETGELTPQNVVDQSRPPQAVLHQELDLNVPVGERAEMWSRHKARNIINVVTILPVRPDGQEHSSPVPAFVNVTRGNAVSPESRTYVSFEDVMGDPQMRANLIQRLLEGLVRKQREYRCIRELEPLWNVVDELVQQYEVVVD